MSNEQLREAWHRGAEHYRELATTRAAEGPSVQLACLVLAQYCVFEESGDYGGPTPEMVALAESVVGEGLDAVVATLEKAATP